MAKPKLSSLVVMGVDWGVPQGPTGPVATDRWARRLLDLFERKRIRATWGVRELAVDWMDRVRRSQVAQELALDMAAQTPQDAQGSFEFAATVRQRVQSAKAAGLRYQSIVLDPEGCVPYRSLAKLGFRTVRPRRAHHRQLGRQVQPQALRYGLWGLPVSASLPQPTRWIRRFATRQVAYGLRRAAAQSTVLHVIVDLQQIVAQGDPAMQDVTRIIETAAALRDQRLLSVGRLIDVDRLVRQEFATRPMQSILHRAG